MVDTTGFTIDQWLDFHHKSTPGTSLETLQKLVASQKVAPEDPAWISVASKEEIAHQWKILQSRANKKSLKLYGVPVAVKDNIDAKGFQTTAACPSFAYTPEKDATTVALLREQGAIIIGKTNLDQFATGLVGVRSPYGRVPNTFSDKHVSGGSSSGSASVVARGIVTLALTTDTAGSTRVPAALNNLISIKPSVGVFSCSGVVPACKSLDCVGVFATTLKDTQTAFSIMAQPDTEQDEYSRALPANPLTSFGAKPKVAIPTNLPWYGETENPKLYQRAIENLSKIGCDIVAVDFTDLLDLAKCLYEGAWVGERYAATRDFLATNPPEETLDKTVIGIIKTATKFDAADTFTYEYKRQGILQKVRKMMQDIDVLAVPTCPLNPTLKDLEDEPVLVNSQQGTWTNFVNLADMCAIALPAGFRPDGLPNGVTLIGKTFTEHALFELGSRYLKFAFTPAQRPLGALKVTSGLGDEYTKPAPSLANSIKLAVVGAHLSGMALHWQLEKVNATLLEKTTTSENYRLYALPKSGPVAKPGLRRVSELGSKIIIEVYSVPKERFGDFIAMVPEPLGIGSVETASGEWVKSFICEEIGYTQKGTKDITEFGGWRPYIESAKASEKKKPFNAVLVANRGEITVRIIKTLKKLGIKAIAIYSDPDKYSQHVLDADVAIPLHGNSAAETYINIDKVIAAAKESGAEAIIPGYGFLSENADFADRCEKEGIVFVGPSGDSIRKLGLKHSAREIAEKAGVPLVPGSGLIADVEEAVAFAKKLGLSNDPETSVKVMLKSTAGGGGIGLQKVDLLDDLPKVFETVKHQGQAYFGDSGVFLERFVENARHVEIQMFGDGFGQAIALGERDCSLQRRNQKIIEETPAPNLPETTRQAMRKAAEQLGASMNYKCAGTVEFIYEEKRDEFFFLEVNARLQVEHPVTEAVTGLDLVEWMLYIAADNAPDFKSQKIEITGASMEARLYAENPVKGFKPSPGQLTDVVFPEWARIDTWVEKGTVVSAEYDPTLAKIIVHGKDRADALRLLQKALDETVVYGVITNLDYLRSVANSEMFSAAKMHTKILDSYDYQANAFEILTPGAYTTVQDYPGRTGYWRIGVPPSGPMDSYSFRLANKIVGNAKAAPAIEVTLNGPSMMFHSDAVIAVTGGEVEVKVNDTVVKQWEPVNLKRGDKLSIGKLTKGCRAYLAIRGGIDVTEYLGSRSTFALGNMGGYNGRVLKVGDVLFLGQPYLPSNTLPAPESEPLALPTELIPQLEAKEWTVGVTCGPHGSPDFFKAESVEEFFSEKWKVHYNSNRFGVRLIGPKPKWARLDGGEAGLHPSNQHDYVYSIGAINFTGDEPVILTCDGPSLGGFVCEAVVADAEMWKIGQVKPGDLIQFVPITYDSARDLKSIQDKSIESFDGVYPTDLSKLALSKPENPIVATFKPDDRAPLVTYRQAGDRYVLVEYGELKLDLNVSYRINRLIELVDTHQTVGIVEMSQGVRSVLVEFDGNAISQSKLIETLIAYEREILFQNKWQIKSKVFKLPMAFEDSVVLDAVKRYRETIRADAPWLPNNVDFIADVNDIKREDVKDMVYSARFLVLGLGDVFLGAPCAVPLDPRQRLLGTKYNPARTFTPNGAVGIGGMYMCIYAMDSPGGYQLVGRTIPIWDKLKLGSHSTEHPWLLTPFDQVEFYPVSEEEIDKFTEDTKHGQFKVEYEESVFDHEEYLRWIQKNSESIAVFQESQKGEKADEFAQLIQVANADLEKTGGPKQAEEKSYPEGAELVYSENSGRFWKTLTQVGDEVEVGQGLVVLEAMKTEMTVSSPKKGKVYKIVHSNGDMVDAGDVVAVIV
ncbi:CYFA0S01e15346g1_1 [Cyberlindnera fabianii]|uniref:Urea amidolyase n=1 Tax=Cyberlindnera fabianii TaxID=36022 RepID=A0A061ASJ6_CYBFA|nr:CYFA0S01e15346g1_1 [Cyberlindnera fabianii]